MMDLDATLEWDNLDEAFEAIEAELANVARGLTVRVWNSVLSKTPQYHGRMAASWTYSIGTPQYDDRSELVSFVGPRRTQLGSLPPSAGLYAGHPAGIAVSNNANRAADKAFKLGDTVYISNGVDHGEGPYSDDIEEGRVALRPENRPGAPVSRTIDWINANYADITLSKGKTLASLTIGGSRAD